MAQMSPKNKRGPGNRRKKFGAGVREQSQCRFCRLKVKYVDYKDIDTLQKLLTNRAARFFRVNAAETVRNVSVRFSVRSSVPGLWHCFRLLLNF